MVFLLFLNRNSIEYFDFFPFRKMASNAELPIKEENIDDADFESSDLPEYDNKNEPFDSELEGDSQNLRLKNGRLPTLSSHFFANYTKLKFRELF